MPPNYKYEFITKGRLKALEKACQEMRKLHRQLESSGIISSPIINQIKTIRLLLDRATCNPLDKSQLQMLKELLGDNLGEEEKS